MTMATTYLQVNKTCHLTNLAADYLAIRIEQIFQLIIIESFSKIFHVNVSELFSTISHLVHSLSARHEASNITAYR